MKKYIYVFLLLVFFYHVAFSQNIIRGKITDQNNKPLVGASVFVIQQNKGTISNSEGEYQLSNLPNGKITIQVSYIGYRNKVETIFIDNSNIELNVSLIQAPIETNEIVVSGGYTAMQHENAIKIDMLKIDDISNAVTPNFMEIITKVPGVDMISKGSGVSKPVIRGLSMNDILTLNNGVRYENYQFSEHHPLGIDEFGIDNVEIIKGPVSVLYGSDAIGGVIDFIKERPAPIGKIVGDYNLKLFSNSLGMTNNIGIKGATKNFFAGIRFGNKTNADYLQGGGDFVPNTRFLGNSLKANTGYNDENMTLNLFYDFSNYKVGLVEDEAISIVKERGRKEEVFYMLLNNQLFSTRDKFFFNNYILEVNAAYQNSGLIHYEGFNDISIDMNLQTISYETRLYFPSTTKSEFIIGLQGINQINTNNNDREVILLPDARINNYSCFGLFQYLLIDEIKIQTGLRYDYKKLNSKDVNSTSDGDYRPELNRNYGSFSGSFGATFNQSENLLYRFNFASAYRTPNLPELTSEGLHEERYERGDKNLVPVKGYETDLGIDYHTNNVTFDFAGFYNIVNDYIYLSPTNDTTSEGEKIYKYLQDDAVLYGVEAGFHIHPKYFEWFHFVTTFSNVIGKKAKGGYLPFIPANQIHCELRFEKDNFWFFNDAYLKINTLIAFEQNNPAIEESSTLGYMIFDVGVGANLKISNQLFVLAIGANNLLDKKYVDHLSTLKEVGYFNAGRNIYFSLTLPFTL